VQAWGLKVEIQGNNPLAKHTEETGRIRDEQRAPDTTLV
jgi:hypothetical protein